MAEGLTFVNQTGAVEGINQSGSGVSIPETFVRWAQDVLFDRNGLIRRRAPFTTYNLFTTSNDFKNLNSVNERTVATVSTINPVGSQTFGVVVNNSTDTYSRILYYTRDNVGPTFNTILYAQAANNVATLVLDNNTDINLLDRISVDINPSNVALNTSNTTKEVVVSGNLPVTNYSIVSNTNILTLDAKTVTFKELPSPGTSAILTTSAPHTFAVGDTVAVAINDTTFDGTYTITSIPTETTFTYAKSAATVSKTAVSDGFVSNYNIAVGETALVSSSLAGTTNTAIDGSYSISAVQYRTPSKACTFYGVVSNVATVACATTIVSGNTIMTYAINDFINVTGTPSNVIDGGYRLTDVKDILTASVTNKALTTNVATLTTSAAHNFVVGDIVTITGVDATFNGTYIIQSVPTTTTFTYNKTAANVTSAAVSPAGTATRLANFKYAKTNANVEATATTATTYRYNNIQYAKTGTNTALTSTKTVLGIYSTNVAKKTLKRYVSYFINDGNTISLFKPDLSSIVTKTPCSYIGTLSDSVITDCKQAAGKGFWLGFLKNYTPGSTSNDYYQYYWRGGIGVESVYLNCTLNTTGSGNTSTFTNTIQGNFYNASSLKPGMFVYRIVGGAYDPVTGKVNSGTKYYLGVLKETPSANTLLTLEKDILRTGTTGAAADSYKTGVTIEVTNVRPYIRNHSRGLISGTAGASLTLVSGIAGTDAEGHWKSAGLDQGAWALYRASDGAWIGDVGSVTDNTTLVLSGTYYSASISPNTFKADEYVAYKYAALPDAKISSQITSAPTSGVFSATYAGLQWYGNAGDTNTRNRIVFSNYLDPESVDLSLQDSDSIIIPGLSEMRGMASSSSGLLIFMADKTFILRGNSRFNFSLEELYPEGCLSSMSIVEYGGGVFWASRTGIYLFDGSTVRNLTKTNLGLYYSQSIRDFDPQADRIYGVFHKDYLFMNFTAWRSIYAPTRYEPIYADGITTTDAIKDFQAADWDPDFTVDDFSKDSNTPIYWKQNTMYANISSGAGGSVLTGNYTDDANPTGAFNWGGPNTQYVYGPANTSSTEGITFAIYLPTGAVTVISNFGFRGNIKLDQPSGVKTLIGTNIVSAYNGVSNSNPNGNLIVSYKALSENITGLSLSDNVCTLYTDDTSFNIGDFIVVELPTGGSTPAPVSAAAAILNNTYTTAYIITGVNRDAKTISFNKTYAGSIALVSNIANAVVWSPKTALVTTDRDHKLSVGDNIVVSTGNSIFDTSIDYSIFVSSIPTGHTFTYTTPNLITSKETLYSYGALMFLITGTYPRVIDLDTIFNLNEDYTDSVDLELIENIGINNNNYYKGPDFFVQTKHYTVGDPLLKKWFKQVFLNLYLIDGCLRLDFVDNEDNDYVDITKKKHKNWELFTSISYSWSRLETTVLPTKLSPNRSTWKNVENLDSTWSALTNTLYERRKKRFSWRDTSVGFKLYQVNNYRPYKFTLTERPFNVMLESWDIGFKPLRASRV